MVLNMALSLLAQCSDALMYAGIALNSPLSPNHSVSIPFHATMDTIILYSLYESEH